MSSDRHDPGSPIFRRRVGWPKLALGAMVFLVLAGATALVIWAGTAGPEGGRPTDWLRQTEEGNYRVSARNLYGELGTAEQAGGSYRATPADRPFLVVYDAESDRGWLVDLESATYEQAEGEEAYALLGPFDWWMPLFTTLYWAQFPGRWDGDVFVLDSDDGRIVTLEMKGPAHMLSLFRIARDGKILDERRWEYSALGEVKAGDLKLPEGLAEKSPD